MTEQTHVERFSKDPARNQEIGQEIAFRQRLLNDAQKDLSSFVSGLVRGKDLSTENVLQILNNEQGLPFGFLLRGSDPALPENPSVPKVDSGPQSEALEPSILEESRENA